jgi:hypothetical protein
MKRQWFLIQLFQQDKTLFFFVLTFMLGQLFFTWKGVETFPFLHWGMYSGKAPDAVETHIIQLKIDRQNICLSCLPDVQGALVKGTFHLYTGLKKNHFNDTLTLVFDKRFKGKLPENTYRYLQSKILNHSVRVQNYPTWLLHYLADMRMVEYPVIEGRILRAKYTSTAQIDTIGGENLFYDEAKF